jgi:hypothetical protein
MHLAIHEVEVLLFVTAAEQDHSCKSHTTKWAPASRNGGEQPDYLLGFGRWIERLRTINGAFRILTSESESGKVCLRVYFHRRSRSATDEQPTTFLVSTGRRLLQGTASTPGPWD